MRIHRFVGVLAVAATLATAALGLRAMASGSSTGEATPAPMPAKPNFSSMMYLLGTWDCSTESSRRPSASTFMIANALDSSGYWIIGTDIGYKTPWYPYEIHGVDKMTYDPDAKHWIDIYTDDQGNYGVQSSPGLHGNTIVWSDAFFTTYHDVSAESPTTETRISKSKRTMHSTYK
jgi:hypothetical protein